MQGIYIHGSRPKSKKQIKEAVKEAGQEGAFALHSIRLEATSIFGNEYDGPLDQAPLGDYYFVGPDPYTKRNFYGRITVHADRIVVQ